MVILMQKWTYGCRRSRINWVAAATVVADENYERLTTYRIAQNCVLIPNVSMPNNR